MNETVDTAGEHDAEWRLVVTPATAGPGTMGTLEQLTDEETSRHDATENGGAIGVVARTYRSNNGRFLPGNPGGPGHPKKDTDLVKALRAQFPPDVVVKQLVATYNVAEKRGSWRGMLETTRLAIDYTDGTPTKKIQSVRGSPLEFLQALAGMNLDTGETIEVD